MKTEVPLSLMSNEQTGLGGNGFALKTGDRNSGQAFCRHQKVELS
jgi:hypothetical protein